MQNTKTMLKIKNQLKSKLEICNECDKSVSWRSDLFVDRVLDLDNYKTRKKMANLSRKVNISVVNVMGN